MKIELALLALASTTFVTSAYAQSTEAKIAAIPCQQMTSINVRHIPMSKSMPNVAPWGISFSEWNNAAFDNLRKRIRDCSSQLGQDTSNLLEQVQIAEGPTLRINSIDRGRITKQEGYYERVIAKLNAITESDAPKDGIKALRELQITGEYVALEGDLREKIDRAIEIKTRRYRELDAQAQEADALKLARIERERKVQAAESEARAVQQSADKAESEIKQRQAAAIAAEESARRREANQAAIMKEEEEANARIAAALALKQQAAERAAKANATNAKSSEKEQIARSKENAMVAEEQKAEQSLQRMKNELSEKQECSVARKVIDIEQPNISQTFSKFAVEFQAGMREEGCSHLTSSYASAERIRRALASCEPSAAIGINGVVENMRTLSAEQGCGRLQ